MAGRGYAAVALALLAASARHQVPQAPVWLLATCMGLTSLSMALFIRSGLNQTCRDPALILPQMMLAVTYVALMLLVMVLVFGMFNLTVRQARGASFFALVLQGGVMWGLVTWQPLSYSVRQELVHFLFACTTLPTISLFSGQLSNLRDRLRQRKDDLTVALERIQTLVAPRLRGHARPALENPVKAGDR